MFGIVIKCENITSIQKYHSNKNVSWVVRLFRHKTYRMIIRHISVLSINLASMSTHLSVKSKFFSENK